MASGFTHGRPPTLPLDAGTRLTLRPFCRPERKRSPDVPGGDEAEALIAAFVSAESVVVPRQRLDIDGLPERCCVSSRPGAAS
jgi:hypothetical protein